MSPSPERVASFWAKARIRKNGCWEWSGAVTSSGYGSVKWEGKPTLVHRVAAHLVGLVKSPAGGDGILVLHTCDNKRCFNPKHLEAGTHSHNMQQAYKRGIIKQRKGVDSATSKLTAAKVAKIKELIQRGVPYRVIGERFGLSKDTIYKISSGKRHG